MVQQGGNIRVEIEDWGCGFHRQQVASDRYGLQGICEAHRLFGGRAEIDSVPGRGTRVVVELPWTDDDAGGNATPPAARPNTPDHLPFQRLCEMLKGWQFVEHQEVP